MTGLIAGGVFIAYGALVRALVGRRAARRRAEDRAWRTDEGPFWAALRADR